MSWNYATNTPNDMDWFTVIILVILIIVGLLYLYL